MFNYIYVEFWGMCIAFEDYLGSVVDLTVWNAVLSAMRCKAKLVQQVFQTVKLKVIQESLQIKCRYLHFNAILLKSICILHLLLWNLWIPFDLFLLHKIVWMNWQKNCFKCVIPVQCTMMIFLSNVRFIIF